MKKKRTEKHQKNEYRLRVSDDLIWGVHPIVEMLKAEPGRLSEIYLQKDRRGSKVEEIIQQAREAGIKVRFVQGLKITGPESAQIRHQGIAARISRAVLLPFETLLKRFSEKIHQGGKPRLMVCDSIQDPHNLGAIIRSAYGSGMDGVIITRDRSAQPGGTAAKSAAGAMAHIDICQVTNLVTALKKLKEVGAWIYGAVKASTSQSIYETDFSGPACLVVGNEGAGIRPLVQKECDILVSIPIRAELDSLNSSVAAAVVMFEMLRQSSE